MIEQKFHILILIFIDICDFLFFSRLDHEYFLEIINNHFQRIWHIFLRKRLNALKIFHKWKLMIKLQNEIKLQIIRSDNVKKLKFILNKWCEFIDIVSKYIIVYNFFQNDVIERDIKINENQIRIMLQDVELFIKF